MYVVAYFSSQPLDVQRRANNRLPLSEVVQRTSEEPDPRFLPILHL
jgi:hypothetical protein